MTRVEPAVVDRPHDGLSHLGQGPGQYLVIEEITVDIVDVNHVRIQFPEAGHKAPGRQAGGQAVSVKKTRGHPVQQQIHLVSHGNKAGRVRRHAVPGSAVGHIALPARRLGQFSQGAHDFTGRGVLLYHRIDLQQFFHFPPINTPSTRGIYRRNNAHTRLSAPKISTTTSRYANAWAQAADE